MLGERELFYQLILWAEYNTVVENFQELFAEIQK